MPAKITNNATGVLASGISAAATAITVQAGQGALFPTLSGAEYAMATLYNAAGTLEIVKITARSSDTLTVVRGQEGTTAAAWLTGDKIDVRITAAGWASKADLEGAAFTGAVTGTSFTGTGAVQGASLVSTGSDAVVDANKTGSSNVAGLRVLKSASLRWRILGNSDAESTGNLGTNFDIERYADGGTLIDKPLSINRSTGLTTVNKLTVSSGPLTVTAGGAVITAGGLTISAGGAAITGNSTVAGDLTISGNTTIATGGDVTVKRGATPTQGAIFFGNTGTRYLYWDGTSWFLPGGTTLQLSQTAVQLTAPGVLHANTIRDYSSGSISGIGNAGTYVEFIASGAQRGYVDNGGNINAVSNFVVYSDRFYKTAIRKMRGALAILDAIPASRFRRKGSKVQEVGFIAQDVEEFLPEAVDRNLDGKLTLKMMPMIATLWAALREERALRAKLERRISKIEERM